MVHCQQRETCRSLEGLFDLVVVRDRSQHRVRARHQRRLRHRLRIALRNSSSDFYRRKKKVFDGTFLDFSNTLLTTLSAFEIVCSLKSVFFKEKQAAVLRKNNIKLFRKKLKNLT